MIFRKRAPMSPTLQHVRRHALAACGALLLALPTFAQKAPPVAQGPDLDLSIRYYTRVLTDEGVLRESRYEETMLRRRDHVWVARVLPGEAVRGYDDPAHAADAEAKAAAATHVHKHFNHVVLPRHVVRAGDKTRVEFIDAHAREVIAIAPTDYDNVNFDGSWNNAFFLVDPQAVAALPLSPRSAVPPGARWHEREKNGIFQRVLWDEQRRIPLVVESGNRNGSVFRRIEITPQAGLASILPWQNLNGYAQKEYADFLD